MNLFLNSRFPKFNMEIILKFRVRVKFGSRHDRCLPLLMSAIAHACYCSCLPVLMPQPPTDMQKKTCAQYCKLWECGLSWCHMQRFIPSQHVRYGKNCWLESEKCTAIFVGMHLRWDTNTQCTSRHCRLSTSIEQYFEIWCWASL